MHLLFRHQKPALSACWFDLSNPTNPLPFKMQQRTKQFDLRLVSRCRDIATTSGPVDVDILALWVFLVGALGLDSECVSSKVITLSLEEVGWEVLCAVAIEPTQCSAESRSRYAEKCRLGDNVSPSRLGLVDGLVEEVIEQQVLKIRVVSVS